MISFSNRSHLSIHFSDPNLCKILIKCYNEKHTEDIETTTMDEKNMSNVVNNENQPQSQQTKNDASDSNVDECLLCSEKKRDTVFKPCGHVASCEPCGSRIKKCLICRETVSSREKVFIVSCLAQLKFTIFFLRSTNVSSVLIGKLRCSSSLVDIWWLVIIALRL